MTSLAYDTNPSWAPDHTWFVFGSSAANISALYWSTLGPSATVTEISGANWPWILLGRAAKTGTPVISPDGNTLAFSWTYDGARSGIGTANLDGSGSKAPVDTLCSGYRLPCPRPENPSWSPDGKRIAYEAVQKVWVINADGTGGGATPTSGKMPAWSDKGILFASDGSAYLMNPDGSGVQKMLSPPPGFSVLYPAWAPDGTAFAYVLEDPVALIYRIQVHLLANDTDSSKDVQIAETVRSSSPAWK